MGEGRIPPPALLVAGVLWSDEEAFDRARDEARRIFGEVEAVSPPRPFRHTDYYGREMGTGLKRAFWSFASPVPRGLLAEAKLGTIRIERALARDGKRRVNLDPGLLTLEAVVLATTKGYAHRVYLGKGIHAEVTLLFREGSFRTLPWTYPDYREDTTLAFLEKERERLKSLLREGPRG